MASRLWPVLLVILLTGVSKTLLFAFEKSDDNAVYNVRQYVARAYEDDNARKSTGDHRYNSPPKRSPSKSRLTQMDEGGEETAEKDMSSSPLEFQSATIGKGDEKTAEEDTKNASKKSKSKHTSGKNESSGEGGKDTTKGDANGTRRKSKDKGTAKEDMEGKATNSQSKHISEEDKSTEEEKDTEEKSIKTKSVTTPKKDMRSTTPEEDNGAAEEDNGAAEEDDGGVEALGAEEDNVVAEEDDSAAEEDDGSAEEDDGVAEEDGCYAKEGNGPAEEDDRAAEKDDGAAEKDDGAAERDDGAAEKDDRAAEKDDGVAEEDDGVSDEDDGAAEKDELTDVAKESVTKTIAEKSIGKRKGRNASILYLSLDTKGTFTTPSTTTTTTPHITPSTTVKPSASGYNNQVGGLRQGVSTDVAADTSNCMTRACLERRKTLGTLAADMSKFEGNHEQLSTRLFELDCSDIAQQNKKSGVHTFYLEDKGKRPVRVMCDMETDGGGWTVVQRRKHGSKFADFNRGWHDYKIGFGDPNEDYWAGLENMYIWTNARHYELRIDLMDFNFVSAYAIYDRFYLEDEGEGYRLHVSGYHGTAGDALSGQANYDNFTSENMMFTTYDRDNDMANNINCASYWNSGGWWYNRCTWANLNGPSYKQADDSGIGINWHTWRNRETLMSSSMMIRPYGNA